MLILQELVCDMDIGTSSFYMTIDLSSNGDKKLHFTCPWDFDTAMKNAKSMSSEKNYNELFAANSSNPWMVLFYKSEFIRNKIIYKWNELQMHNFQELVFNYLEQCTNLYVSQYDKNYQKWKNIAPFISQNWNSLINESKIDDWYMSWWWFGEAIYPESAMNCSTQKQASEYVKDFLNLRFNVLNNLWNK